MAILEKVHRYEFRAYRRDGTLARIVRRDHDGRTPAQADLDAYRANYLKGVPSDPEFEKLLTKVVDALALPPSFPAFSAIEVDLLGHLWVREYIRPREEDRALWTVFDPGRPRSGLHRDTRSRTTA